MDIKAITSRIAKQYETRDPFRIADELGVVVVFVYLVGIRGFRQNVHRRTVIYISSELDEYQQRLVCAHELGHHFMHRGMNRVFMDSNTYMVTDRFENEANRFALELLFEDDELQPFLDRYIEDAALFMGVPVSLAIYRMGSVRPNAWL